MMRVKVITIFGMIASLGGKKKQMIQIREGSNMMDLMEVLIERHGSLIKDRVFHLDKTIKKDITILLNGRNILALQGFETKLTDGDEVLLFPPLAGG